MKGQLNRSCSLAIAGGGTGGHVFAGIAVAKEWVRLLKESESSLGAPFGDRVQIKPGCQDLSSEPGEVYFVGVQGGIEETLVARENFPLFLLKLGALNHTSFSRKIRTMVLLPFAFIKAIRILLRFRPTFVMGVGGYASGPFILAASLMGVKSAILEQNSVPGLTNRILSRFVDIIFYAFKDSEVQFPSHKKKIYSGNPIRTSELTAYSQERNKESLNRPFMVFVFGGSLGAMGINSMVLDSLPHLEKYKSKIKFIHQTGDKDFQRVKDGFENSAFQAEVEKFIYDMNSAYQKASLVICRAGSSTLAELAYVGRAAILIPFPFASDQHQEKNALSLVKSNAAWILRQNEAKGKDLADRIIMGLEDPTTLREMELEVSKFSKPYAAKTMVQVMAETVGIIEGLDETKK